MVNPKLKKGRVIMKKKEISDPQEGGGGVTENKLLSEKERAARKGTMA